MMSCYFATLCQEVGPWVVFVEFTEFNLQHFSKDDKIKSDGTKAFHHLKTKFDNNS